MHHPISLLNISIFCDSKWIFSREYIETNVHYYIQFLTTQQNSKKLNLLLFKSINGNLFKNTTIK